jgi:hypothetical protein
MSEEPKSQGWFHTVPGIMTATAAILTAATGLIVVLKPVDNPTSPAASSSPSPAASSSPSPTTPTQQLSAPSDAGNTASAEKEQGKNKNKGKGWNK